MSKRRTRFITWAKKDPDDETKISYVFEMHLDDGSRELKTFTSEDPLPFWMLERVRNAWIDSINRTSEGWYVVLYED